MRANPRDAYSSLRIVNILLRIEKDIKLQTCTEWLDSLRVANLEAHP